MSPTNTAPIADRKRCSQCELFVPLASFQYLARGDGGDLITKVRAVCFSCIRPIDNDVYFNPLGADPRECSCGRIHESVPNTARLGGDGLLRGLYFECPCGSTLFVPTYGSEEVA